jgi:hypothetical protein
MKHLFRSLDRALALAAVAAVSILAQSAQAGGVQSTAILKPKVVRELSANAKTRADHLKLARHFAALADKHEADAKEHAALAEEYARNPRLLSTKIPMAPNSAEHCRYFAEHCSKLAAEMRAKAAEHEAMANGLAQ